MRIILFIVCDHELISLSQSYHHIIMIPLYYIYKKIYLRIQISQQACQLEESQQQQQGEELQVGGLLFTS